MNAGLSQTQLGVDAGLEEASASARMNRYELGKREPTVDLVERFAKVLNLPVAYFYATDDKEAWLLATMHRVPASEREKIIEMIRERVSGSSAA